MDKALEKLKHLCDINDIPITESQLQKFDVYLKLYLKWNKVHNLSSIRKKEDVVVKHFFDSLTLIKLFEKEKISVEGKEIADLGAGGGFPSVPLKIYYEDKFKLFLIEAVQKKCVFLEMLRKELNLDYTVLCDRSENIQKNFDIVVSRATGETFDVLKWGKDILKSGGYLIIMKAKKVEEELKPFTVSLSFKNYPDRKFIVVQKR
jgi:16S rRNA (guanine527-N7)-methyltransferase